MHGPLNVKTAYLDALYTKGRDCANYRLLGCEALSFVRYL